MYARTGRGRDSTGLPITDRQGRTIGRIVGRDYQKIVARADQMLRSPPGFGFDAWAMEQLVLPRVDRITVICRFDGKVYTASVETFCRYRMAIDRGAGLQYVLPLGYWSEEREGEPRAAAAAKGQHTPARQDLSTPRAAARSAPPVEPETSTRPVQGRLF
jgi:hypothetical protein